MQEWEKVFFAQFTLPPSTESVRVHISANRNGYKCED